MIEFEPIFDRILIRRVDSNLQKKTEAIGLVLPDKVKDEYKAMQGVLIKCGPECHESVHALLGKEVLFNRFSGDEIKLNGEEFLLATDRDIFGGITNDGQ